MDNISLPVKTNRHPVDELADVRKQIKELKEIETELGRRVADLMGEGHFLCGDEYIAKQIASHRIGVIDATALKKAGINPDNYRKPSTQTHQIRLEPRILGND